MFSISTYTFRNKIQNSNVNERRTRNCIFSPKLFLCVHLLENIRNQWLYAFQSDGLCVMKTHCNTFLLTGRQRGVTNTFLFCEVIETTLLQVTSKERGENCHRTKKSTLLAWKKAHLNWIMARDECQFRLPNKNCRRGKEPNSVFSPCVSGDG